MRNLREELQRLVDVDESNLKKQVEEIRAKAILAKNTLLTKSFHSFPDNATEDDKAEYILQFIPLLSELVMFPDEEIFEKLKKLKFGTLTFKWFVSIEDILSELNRLKSIKGLFFLQNSHFTFIRYHLETSIQTSMIEGFELNIIYNKVETNILQKGFSNEYNRRLYNQKKKQIPKMSRYQEYVSDMINKMEMATNNKKIAKDLMMQPMRGNTAYYYSMLSDFLCDGISQRKAFEEMFPLVKLIMKNERFLSEDEFMEKKDVGYLGVYKDYKISRVKKILLQS
jgi:hypothetical protein